VLRIGGRAIGFSGADGSSEVAGLAANSRTNPRPNPEEQLGYSHEAEGYAVGLQEQMRIRRLPPPAVQIAQGTQFQEPPPTDESATKTP
jgi:hypothetical protein